MRRGIFIALESENEEVVEDNSVVEDLETAAELNEIAEDQSEIQEDADTVSDALDDVGELDAISEVMEDSVEKEEGMSEDAAELAVIATERICMRLNYKPKSAIIPSLESFGSAGSRLESTKIALEKISETLSKVWEAIKGFFSRIWESIKAFVKRVFDGAERLAARAEKVNERVAKAIEGDVKPNADKKIKLKKYSDIFYIRTEGEMLGRIESVVEGHVEATKLSSATNKGVAEFAGQALNASKDNNGVSAAINKAVKGINGLKLAYDTKVSVSDENQLKIDSKTNAGADIEVSPADPAKLKDTVSNVINLAAALKSSKEGFKAAETTVNGIIKLMDKLSNKDNKEAMEGSIATLKTAQKLMVFTNSQLPGTSLKVGNSALNFVQDNLA